MTMALAASLAVCLGIGAWLGLRELWSEPDAARRSQLEARLEPVIVRAEDGYWPGRRRVRRGDEFPLGSSLRVGGLGEVVLDLRALDGRPGAGGAPRPVAASEGSTSEGRLEVGPESLLSRDAEGRWALETGTLGAELQGNLELDLVGGGGAVAFSTGRFLVSSMAVVRHDQALDPLGARRIRVEVAQGEAVVVTGDDQIVLGAGVAGVFVTGDRWRTEPMLDDAAITAAFGPSPEDAADDVWVSRVVDEASGQPLVGATVTVWSDSGVHFRRTDREGRFRMAGLERWVEGSEDPIVVAVRPAPEAGWAPMEPRPGLYLPMPVALRPADVRAGRGVSGPRLLAETIVVPSSRVLGGRVSAVDHRPLADAAVWPAVHDELLGTIEFLNEFVAFTDASGAFQLAGLPARTGPMQSLVALVARDGFEPRLIDLDADVRKGNAPLAEVRLEAVEPPESVVVSVDPSAREAIRWQVAKTMPHLGGAAVLLRVVEADQGALLVPALGGASVAGGLGRWVRPLQASGAWGAWRAIEVGAAGFEIADEPALQRDLPKVLRRQRGAVGQLEFSEAALASAMGVDLAGGNDEGVVSFEWIAGLRYQHVLPRAAGPDAHWVSAVDMSSRHVRAIDVFVEGEDHRVRFAGSFDSFSNCAVELDAGMRVFGVDRDGAVGQIQLAPGAVGQRGVRVPMASLSRLELGSALRSPTGRVRVELRGSVPGITEPMHLLRTIEAGGHWMTSWLPPGHWVASLPDGTTQQLMLDPGRTVTLR